MQRCKNENLKEKELATEIELEAAMIREEGKDTEER